MPLASWWRSLFPTRSMSFVLYRYRYLAVFVAIGFLSILIEIIIGKQLSDNGVDWPIAAGVAFVGGLFLSFFLNATLNFRVSRKHLLATFYRYAFVSILSFALNLVAIAAFRHQFGIGYGTSRLICSGVLFVLAYCVHRRYTFDLARNFGVAVYASADEDVDRIHQLLGPNCDHLHIDLVDETMNANCAPVDLGKITRAKELWPGQPVCLHMMSLEPTRWLERAWADVDWFLFHINVRDNLDDLIFRCRMGGKKVGVVWHVSAAPSELLRYLPHVDFVMVLGIAQPGCSGQKLLDEAVDVINVLDEMRDRYGYDVMVDGGVNMSTLERLRARYVVAASAVLRASDPVRAAHTIRTGVRYERKSA